MVSISRLCDAACDGKHNNISFKALLSSFNTWDELSLKVDEFVKLCGPIVTYRNKRVAHSDLGAVIKPKTNILPGISRYLISEAVRKAEEILNFVLEKYEDAQLMFELPHVGGGNDLIYWLKMGKYCADVARRQGRPIIAVEDPNG
jgi:hypothetical protein